MTLNRRTFLQGASLTLGALGLGGSRLLWPAQYAQALGKPARRKLALLIGINPYPDRSIGPTPGQDVALKGCLTDVEMQRQLLIHRCGFAPQDILTLTNQAATRQGILNALDQHLVQQAQADDVVLLHFSGYGSQVRWVGNPSRTYRTWIPVDGRLPSSDQPALNDLLEVEIAALLRRIATANLTTVIDAGSQDTGYLRWGNLRVRSRPTVPTGNLPEPFLGTVAGAREGETPWPGLLLRANTPGNLVLEGPWDGFSAGLFTYALTQSLWETMADPNPRVLMQRTGDRIQRWTGPDQVPVLGNVLAPKAVTMPYSLPPEQPNAVGMAIPTEQRSFDLWLGGLSPELLHYLQPGSRFTIPAPSTTEARAASPVSTPAPVPDPLVELRLESRMGLHGLAKPVVAEAPLPAAAQPLYENVRVLPTNLPLALALDSQLKRVERVDATSALAGLAFVSVLAAGERNADGLFGRLPLGPRTAEGDRPASADRPVESSYGLFAPNRTLLPGTMLAKEEAVKTAITRLTPTLRFLLALKLLRLTQNRFSSGLSVLVAMESVQPKPTVLLRQQTEVSRLSHPGLTDPGLGPTPLNLSRDTRFQYRLTNLSDVPLHSLIIRCDSQGDCSALIVPPEDLSTAESIEPTLFESLPSLAPGQTRLVPNSPNGWGILGNVTQVETHIILSLRPFSHALEVLATDSPGTPLQTEPQRVSQPLKFAQALLQDLHTNDALPEGRSATEVYALDHRQWATLAVNYGITSG
ncbi:MAG: caspase family protein [Leptolyngbya sp.]|nr:caspase family protein [Leptolyngbya sp.]